MKNVEAIETVTFGAGNILKLSERQAVPRMAVLEALDGGTFKTTGEVQFKKGETFGLEGTISKAMLESILIDGKPGRPVVETTKPKGPVKFLMPSATDTPAAQQARLDKLPKKGK